jgi:hypothetical protein
MGMITLDVGLYGVTVVLFHIISVVHLWLVGSDHTTEDYVHASQPSGDQRL